MKDKYLLHVIAFCGLSTAGKTTAAEYLVEEYGATRLRFAKPLRDMLEPLGLTVAELYGELKQVPCDTLNGLTPEHVLRELGMWIRKTIGVDFLTSVVERELQDTLRELLYQHEFVVIEDLRCVNEREMLRRFALAHKDTVRVHIVRIKRAAALTRIDPAILDIHSPKYTPLEGEHQFFSHDYVLYNEGSPEDFEKTLRRLVNDIEAKG